MSLLNKKTEAVVAESIVFFVVVSPIILGIFIFLKQCIDWLHYGYWEKCSLISCSILDAGQSLNTTQWIGVDKILSFIPLSVCFIAFGLLLSHSYYSSHREINKINN